MENTRWEDRTKFGTLDKARREIAKNADHQLPKQLGTTVVGSH